MSNDAGSGSGNADETPDNRGDNPFKGTPFEQIFGAFGSGGMPDLGGMDLSALMGQMQALMQPYDGPVNWPLAIDVARRTSAQEPDPTVSSAQSNAVADAVRLADHWLDETTEFPSGVTTTAAWSRAEWIVETIDVWKVLVEPIAGSATAALSQAMPEEMRQLFLNAMTDRAAKLMREDMVAMGPVRARDCEEAQASLVRLAKSLGDRGEIVLVDPKSDDAMIY